MKSISLGILVFISMHGKSQDDSSKLSISAYLEPYFAYDYNEPQNHQRPGFLYSYNRHNELNINLAYVKTSFQDSSIRANFSLMAGTYASSNLSKEGMMQFVNEANAGIRLSKKHSLWLDAGVLPSHIGFESPAGKDGWNLSRSIVAENSPYYECGARLSYKSKNDRWYFAVLYLNGWQRIIRPPGFNYPNFGTQLTYSPGEKFTFNHSSFWGTDYPDKQRRMRAYDNFYSIFKFNKKFWLTAGFDIGFEQVSKGSREQNIWYSPVLIARYAFNYKTAVASRIEYFCDTAEIVARTPYSNDFKMFGFSINLDRQIHKKLLWRMEARALYSEEVNFLRYGKGVNRDFLFTTSICVSLDK